MYEDADDEDGAIDALILAPMPLLLLLLLELLLLLDFFSLRLLLLFFVSPELCLELLVVVVAPLTPPMPIADGNAAARSGCGNGDKPDACSRVK